MWRCAEKASSEVSSHHTSQILHWEIHKGGKSHLASFWLGVLLTDADILCPGEGLQEVVGMLVLLRWVQLHTTPQPWGPSQRGAGYPQWVLMMVHLITMGSDEVSPHLAQHCLFSNLTGLSSRFQWTPQNDQGPLLFLQRWQMGKGSPHLLPSHNPPLPFQLYWHGCSMFRNFQNIHSSYTCRFSQELTTLPSAWIGASEWAGSVRSEHAPGWEMNRHFCFLLGTLNQLPEIACLHKCCTPRGTDNSAVSPPLLGHLLRGPGLGWWRGRCWLWSPRCCLFLRFGSSRGLALLAGCPLGGGVLAATVLSCGWWKRSSTQQPVLTPGCQGSSCTIL